MQRLPIALASALIAFTLAQVAAAAEVIVDEVIDVPVIKEEIVPIRPSFEEIWVPGEWDREPGKWTWISGKWVKPPHKKSHWAKGHWNWESGKWHWTKGHWSVASDDIWIVDETIDIPYSFPEQKPPKPSATNHWVSGHWDWNGGWFWIPGYYTERPDPKAVWVPGRWEPYSDSGYWWMGGHWKIVS